jgi:glyoxylase-like metal-dependent hydrolase (beta-lactamase superfamily II)
MTAIYAVRYGTLATTRGASFLDYAQYGQPDGPQQLDYYYWVIASGDQVILVDTGFDPRVGRRRGREVLIDPVDALELIGFSARDVDQVIVSHFHYDHIGNVAAFPTAQISFQRRELSFWTGAEAADAEYAALIEDTEIRFLSDALVDGRARALDGDTELASGVVARLVGGHTPGEQIVTVETDGGLVVLAADAVHFYEEMELGRPYAVAHDPPAMLSAYHALEQMRLDGATIVAGHDPGIVTRFPPAGLTRPGIVVQIAA